MTTVQLYRVDGSFPSSAPGQFVYESDESNMICGFISKTEQRSIEICLFEPIAISALTEKFTCLGDANFTVVSPSCDWSTLLTAALEKNPSVKQNWINLLSPSQ